MYHIISEPLGSLLLYSSSNEQLQAKSNLYMILLFRYNSEDYAYCLSNAVLNITQEQGICTGRTLCYLHGIRKNNDHDLDHNAELSNAMVLLVNAGFISGSVGTNIQRYHHGRWCGSHGIVNANIFRIKEENLATLLCTSQGKSTLTTFIANEFGNATVSVAQGRGTEKHVPYIFLPMIQKKQIIEWTVEERDNGLIRSLVTPVNNNRHTQSDIHTCQIVELDDASTIYDLDLTLVDDMDGAPFLTTTFLADKPERQFLGMNGAPFLNTTFLADKPERQFLR